MSPINPTWPEVRFYDKTYRREQFLEGSSLVQGQLYRARIRSAAGPRELCEQAIREAIAVDAREDTRISSS